MLFLHLTNLEGSLRAVGVVAIACLMCIPYDYLEWST